MKDNNNIPLPLIKADLVKHYFEIIATDPERLAQAAELLVASMSPEDLRRAWNSLQRRKTAAGKLS